MMELYYQGDGVLSNWQAVSLLNVTCTQTVPDTNFISKTNAELMRVALIGRKWLSDKVRNMGDSRKRKWRE